VREKKEKKKTATKVTKEEITKVICVY